MKKKSETPANQSRVFWICLIFFACAWMFVLGILVGRGTAPVQFDIDKLQKELAALKQAVIKKEELRFKIDSKAASRKTEMDFYERLKASGKDTLSIDSQPRAGADSQKKPLQRDADLQKTDKVAPPPAVRAETSSKGGASTLLPGLDSEKKLTIQVASLKDAQTADRMVAELRDKWYPAYRTTAEIQGKGVWYRVRIGSFKNQAEAQSTLDSLKKDKIDAILLSR